MDDLSRFVQAQDAHGAYDQALAELRRGRKTSHWMWFVLPQVRGLGRSGMAVRYGIADLDEAGAYLAHPVLGPRLHECCEALLALPAAATADAVMGGIDALKLRSSMTLFHRADPQDPAFTAVLERYFGGAVDDATDALLA
ncbi:DUF1810 domain-containing protein [Arsenicicoccus cauae]|uniref:DUF1810 domain-containing protein n=1 Tax=Arsenicicoccus cauae TaxID=2663847 RepID=UPI00370DDB87